MFTCTFPLSNLVFQTDIQQPGCLYMFFHHNRIQVRSMLHHSLSPGIDQELAHRSLFYN